MSATEEAALMILKAKASDAKSRANQAEVYAVYALGNLQEDVDKNASILERTMTNLFVIEAKHERSRAQLLEAAVKEAEANR